MQGKNRVTAREREMRARVGKAVRSAIENTRGGATAIAKAWELDDETASVVYQMATEGHEKEGNLTVARALLMPKSALMRLRDLLDDVIENGPRSRLPEREHALRIAGAAGRLAEDAQRGDLTAERKDLDRIEEAVVAARRDLENT